jgi:hypothetical protein
MTVTYEIEAEELNDNFLASLRSLFKGGRLKVTVEEEIQTDISNLTKDKVLQALESKEILSFSIDDFEVVSSQINAGTEVNIDSFKVFVP